MVTCILRGSAPAPVYCTTPRIAAAEAGSAGPRQTRNEMASATHFTADMRTPCRRGELQARCRGRVPDCTLAKRHGSAGARSVGVIGGPLGAPYTVKDIPPSKLTAVPVM